MSSNWSSQEGFVKSAHPSVEENKTNYVNIQDMKAKSDNPDFVRVIKIKTSSFKK